MYRRRFLIRTTILGALLNATPILLRPELVQSLLRGLMDVEDPVQPRDLEDLEDLTIDVGELEVSALLLHAFVQRD